jgi:hypothetical protein
MREMSIGEDCERKITPMPKHFGIIEGHSLRLNKHRHMGKTQRKP